MPAIVGEGRRVINNITRARVPVPGKNAVFLPVVGADAVPAPGLSLPAGAVDAHQLPDRWAFLPFFWPWSPNQERGAGGAFWKRCFAGRLPGAVAVAVCSALAMASGQVFGLTMDVDNTIACLVTALVGLLVLLRVCVPLNPARGALLAVMTAGLVCGVDPGGEGFLPGAFAGNGRVDHPGAVRPGAGTDAPGGRVDETRGKAARGVQSDGLRACGRSVKRGGH